MTSKSKINIDGYDIVYEYYNHERIKLFLFGFTVTVWKPMTCPINAWDDTNVYESPKIMVAKNNLSSMELMNFGIMYKAVKFAIDILNKEGTGIFLYDFKDSNKYVSRKPISNVIVKQTIKYDAGAIIVDIKGKEFLYLGTSMVYQNGSMYAINRNNSAYAYLSLDDLCSVVSYDSITKYLFLQFNGIGYSAVDTYVKKKKAVNIRDKNFECSILRVENNGRVDTYKIVQM